MTIKKIIRGVLIAVSVLCTTAGALLILGSVGEFETNPEATTAWFFHNIGRAALLFIPGAITILLEDVLED